jgi:hypothetical protein
LLLEKREERQKPLFFFFLPKGLKQNPFREDKEGLCFSFLFFSCFVPSEN